jgi:predicted nucleic acid-binding Zn ribbon protein
MPLYEYEVVLPDGTGGEVFEVLQGMAEKPLTEHPESGEPVRRVFGVPNAPRKWTASQGKTASSDKNLERTGFTKYVKGDDGKYQKLFGKGPAKISKPPSQ